jgi:Uncharacterised nucleotidyltransferase
MMSADGLDPRLRMLAMRSLRVDRLTAEVMRSLKAVGIPALLLKGPAIAEWLYPGEVRDYGDSDLLVFPADWDQAVAQLETAGFHAHLEGITHPRMDALEGTAFLRGDDNVDLHYTLPGLGGDPATVVARLLADGDRQLVGGEEVTIPNRAALLLHVALHAAHHSHGKPVEDLRRAIDRADADLWERSLELALALQGTPAFASGLRLLPQGEALVVRLGIDAMHSPLHELRREGVPTAEGLHALLAPGLGLRRRLHMVARELVPSPEFMRWWSPLARRGTLGLAAAYVWRPAWLLAKLPRALAAFLRVRRATSS